MANLISKCPKCGTTNVVPPSVSPVIKGNEDYMLDSTYYLNL